MKDKTLYIIMIDISYSVQPYLNDVQNKINELISSLKEIDKDIFIQIIGLYECEDYNLKLLLDKTNVKDIPPLQFKTDENFFNSFEGFKEAKTISRQWKKQYFYSNILNFNCDCYVLIITDIECNLINLEEEVLIKELCTFALSTVMFFTLPINSITLW